MRLLIATSNPGKLRDFAGAATGPCVEVLALPGFAALPGIIEDAPAFEGNARKKAEHYSRFAPGEIVVADDSGLEADPLGGKPGVHSARYADYAAGVVDLSSAGNTHDADNNARLLRDLDDVADERRTARFVCVLAAARDGRTLATFRGEAAGVILRAPRGSGGFGYDPLFFLPAIGKTFAELSAEEKARYSHRGAAFRKLLEWCRTALPQH
ncbi:MAG TPA: non-canonical purine NTP pyrophosphatase [Terriglobales bacterium]|nr:non-canonical purine NTP pyrophosphatase [Terriglobales bacterium]